jgi:hypothetical protein
LAPDAIVHTSSRKESPSAVRKDHEAIPTQIWYVSRIHFLYFCPVHITHLLAMVQSLLLTQIVPHSPLYGRNGVPSINDINTPGSLEPSRLVDRTSFVRWRTSWLLEAAVSRRERSVRLLELSRGYNGRRQPSICTPLASCVAVGKLYTVGKLCGSW